MARWARRTVEVVFWWGATLGIWLLSLSAVSGQELAVAVPVSLVCGVLAVSGRLATRHAWTARPGWLRSALVMPVAIVSDTFEVLASAVTGKTGEFRRVPVGGGRGEGVVPESRRAAATFWTSVTPGSYVIDIDPDNGAALMHVLADHGPPTEDMATR